MVRQKSIPRQIPRLTPRQERLRRYRKARDRSLRREKAERKRRFQEERRNRQYLAEYHQRLLKHQADLEEQQRRWKRDEEIDAMPLSEFIDAMIADAMRD
jgi:hypothetical protein